MKIKVGSSRCAFVFKNVTIKVPKFWEISRLGLGIVENLKERYWYCADSHVSSMDINQYPLAPILYASRNGLIMVMRTADVIEEDFYNSLPQSEQLLLDEQLERLKAWAKGFDFVYDLRWGNVGFIDNKLVAVDYGYALRAQYYDCPAHFRHDTNDGQRKSIPTVWGKLYLARRAATCRLKEMFDAGKELWAWVGYGGMWLALGARVLYNKVFHGKDD
jgi:hypothetical protein